MAACGKRKKTVRKKTPAEKPAAATIAERVNERVAARSRGGFDAGFDDLASPDRADDNVEIPAFLRRQAN